VNIQVINNYTPILPSITNLDEFESILEELYMYNPRLGPIRWAGITQQTLLGVSHISAYTLHCDFREAFGVDIRQTFIPAGGKGKPFQRHYLRHLEKALREFCLYTHIMSSKEKEK
jgi:hypothetical protein